MQWFQANCPTCGAHLQVRLPEGITSVQCSECKAVFAVQIQPTALTPQAQPASSKRSRKRKSEKDTAAPPRALSAYNVFMKAEVAKVKAEHPQLAHREAFKMAAERWQASPMNPQNGGERCASSRQTTLWFKFLTVYLCVAIAIAIAVFDCPFRLPLRFYSTRVDQPSGCAHADFPHCPRASCRGPMRRVRRARMVSMPKMTWRPRAETREGAPQRPARWRPPMKPAARCR